MPAERLPGGSATMLVVTSNWALSDGSLTAARGGRLVGRLESIRRAIVRAGWGRDGRYRPLSEATVVFAGDTFDWLCSDAWAGVVRPWHVGRRAAQARRRVALTANRAAGSGLAELRRWLNRGIDVPAADGRGRPSDRVRSSAHLRLVVLAGDRDWWLPELAAAAGRFGIPVGEEWSDGERLVRHGHDLDPLASRSGLREPGVPTLAESLTVDLVVALAIDARGDRRLWPLVRSAVGRLRDARPSGLPGRVAALSAAAEAGDLRGRMVSLWRRRVAGWHATVRRDPPSCDATCDAVDELAGWFERLDPEARPPAAVSALDIVSPRNHGTIVAHATEPHGPVAECHASAGRSWREHLDATPPGPAVITVGADDSGSGFVDAA